MANLKYILELKVVLLVGECYQKEQHKHGRHRYEPSLFGLDAIRVHGAFEAYVDRFLG